MKHPWSLVLLFLVTIGNTFAQSSNTPFGSTVTWDRHGLMFDGHRACLVMGEMHYSRIPSEEWQCEVKKMREGGVDILATYVFWNHIEEQEGVFDWSGQRSLRHFLEICKQEGMPVVLRIGPWCHGEVRCGGLPDWLFEQNVRVRSEDSVFLDLTKRLYRQIFTQVQGLQWKDGGPVIAAQFDNEWGGEASYLMRLKSIANEIGFDLPFYTCCAWPGLRTPLPFGEMLPLYGDYADGFWDRSTRELAGNYWQAFHFKGVHVSTTIGTDFIDYTEKREAQQQQGYPYFTCELGGGMMCSYHRRPYIYPEDALAMAIVKLGSGSNLLGYYMYHGGTNPEGKFSDLNEMQQTPYTAHNDLPHRTYDFQAPLGEFGQKNPHYYLLRPLHLFMHDFGSQLCPMTAHFPLANYEPKAGDDSHLRWSYRTSSTKSLNAPAFVFVNNYDRLHVLSPKRNVQFEVCGQRFPKHPTTIPSGCSAIFPVNISLGKHTLQYATAQLVAQRNGRVYLMALDGLPAEIKLDGHILKNVRPQGLSKPICNNLYLLTAHDAQRLFLSDPGPQSVSSDIPSPVTLPWRKIQEAGPLRTIVKGPSKVAEQPTDSDFHSAAVYHIDLSPLQTKRSEHILLRIDYRGDVARLYANGRLIDDNFYNGRTFLYALWRLPSDCQTLELRILPLQPDAPIYLPHEADNTAGESLNSVTYIP